MRLQERRDQPIALVEVRPSLPSEVELACVSRLAGESDAEPVVADAPVERVVDRCPAELAECGEIRHLERRRPVAARRAVPAKGMRVTELPEELLPLAIDFDALVAVASVPHLEDPRLSR